MGETSSTEISSSVTSKGSESHSTSETVYLLGALLLYGEVQ